jgi:FRG domain
MNASIFRSSTTKFLRNEHNAIRDIVAVHPNEFSDDPLMFDRLVRAQHFGLPTRLLDVTLNPLVALYFATEVSDDGSDGRIFVINVDSDRRKYYDSDAVSCVANLSQLAPAEKAEITSLDTSDRVSFNKNETVDRLCQFIRSEKPYFRTNVNPIDLYKPFHVTPKLSNRRIIAQAGSFIIYGLGKGPSFARTIRVNSARIPRDAKSRLRDDLHNLGIHEATLFPEIDRAAGYIKRRYS